MNVSLPYPIIFGITSLLLWLLPFFWSGWTKRTVPLLPKSLSFQYSAAGLFTNRSTRWWDHHLEVQAADDARHELAERAVFPMGAFGYRTRYDRILNESNRCSMTGEIRQRLAEHVVRKAGLGGDGGSREEDVQGKDGIRLADGRTRVSTLPSKGGARGDRA